MRVAIAEDLFLLRDGLTRMLQAHGLAVTAAVDNGDDLLTAINQEKPDVAVVDVRLPPTFTDEGLRAARRPARRIPASRSWSFPSTWSSCMPASCWPAAPAASATC